MVEALSELISAGLVYQVPYSCSTWCKCPLSRIEHLKMFLHCVHWGEKTTKNSKLLLLLSVRWKVLAAVQFKLGGNINGGNDDCGTTRNLKSMFEIF